MKTIFLTYIGFIQLIFCCEFTNVTENDPNHMCPISFLRRRRAIVEYTRWRSNIATTPEFIVKVLDEEMTTSVSNQVYGVNIQPVTSRPEKIVVGGAIVGPDPTPEEPRDYTRFVPPIPGTLPVLPRADDDLYLAPVHAPHDPHEPHISQSKIDQLILPIKPSAHRKEMQYPLSIYAAQPVNRHPQRDESPPAGPHFLTRTPTPPVYRQFAPVAVAFTILKTIPPVTPSTRTRPGRTSYMPDALVPTRIAEIEDVDIFQNLFVEETLSKDVQITRSTIEHAPWPTATQLQLTEKSFAEPEMVKPTRKVYDTRRNEIEYKSKDEEDEHKERDFDFAYHNMFNYDDYKEAVPDVNAKPESNDNYEEKLKGQDKNIIAVAETDSESLATVTVTITPTEVDMSMYPDGEEGNTTLSEIPDDARIEIVAHNISKDGSEKRHINCSMIKLRGLNFDSPRTLPEIVVQLNQWALDSPVAKWVDITDGNFTIMENPIYMMIVDDPSSGQIISAKQTVMVVAGIQGRDHYAVASAMYLLYQLIERSESHTDLLTKFRFWVIPVFNPDGYDYSMTFPHRREWTKNLRQDWEVCKGRETCKSCESYGLRCTIQSCYGVNLDRNFEYQWIPTEELLSEHPCGMLYAGVRQLSEAETRALTMYLHGLRSPLHAFIAYKEGEVLGVMYPYSHTKKRRAFDHVYRRRASRAAAAAYSISGRPYVAGQTSEFLPLYAGGIEDWVDGHLGIDSTYTIMMFKPADTKDRQILTKRVVQEAYAATDTLLLQTADRIQNEPRVILAGKGSSSSNNTIRALPTNLTILFTIIAVLLCS